MFEGPAVLLIESHPLVREAVTRHLCGKYEVTARTDALQIIADYETLSAPIVVLAVSFPELNGFAAARILKDRHPEARIVFLSSDPSWTLVNAAFEVGAHGYVLKASAHKELASAIEAARNGDEFVSSSVSPGRLHVSD